MALNKVLKVNNDSELLSFIINTTPELASDIDLPVQGESIAPIGKIIMSIINSNNLTKYDIVEEVENSVDNSQNIEQIARDVIKGKYGNGQERKNKLGNLYNEVQAKVNEILKQKKSLT